MDFVSMPTPQQIANLQQACIAAVASEKSTGCPAELTVPQWVVESRWGLNMPAGSNNPFGIKARPGDPYVTSETTEFVNGTATQIPQNFHKYDTLADAFTAHGLLIATGAPYQAAFEAYEENHNVIALINGIAPRYSTSSVYAATLLEILQEKPVQAAIAKARITQNANV
jgi:flagellum-specific peptidoglycan hydrolase FlgJ